MLTYKRNVIGLIRSIALAFGGAIGLSVIAWIICSVLSLGENLSLIITLVVRILVLSCLQMVTLNTPKTVEKSQNIIFLNVPLVIALSLVDTPLPI